MIPAAPLASPRRPAATLPPGLGVRWAAAARRAVELRIGILVLAATLLLVWVGQQPGMEHYPVHRDDEGTYVSQAWALQTRGELSHYTYFYDHPPFGWMQIAAWTALTGAWDRVTYAVTAGREVMLVAHLVSCALLFLYLRRLGIRRFFAALAVLVFTFSPVALFHHRLVYLDNLATVWILAALASAASRRRHLLAYTVSGGCFALAVLSKETALIHLPAVLVQLLVSAPKPNRRFAVALFAGTLLAVAATYPLYAALKGELLPGPGHVSLYEGVVFQLFGREGSGSIWSPGSDAYAKAAGWLALDRVLLGAGLAGGILCAASRRLRAIAVGMAVPLLLLLRPGYLPYPYVIGLVMFAPMALTAPLDALWRWSMSPSGRRSLSSPWLPAKIAAGRTVAAVVAALLLLVAPEWQRFAVAARQDANHLEAQATDWLIANLPEGARVLSPDPIRIDLVLAGRREQDIVWINKIDSDPEVQSRYPDGWRDFDYLVASSDVRGYVASGEIPEVARALESSVVERSFGNGGDRIEVRRIGPG